MEAWLKTDDISFRFPIVPQAIELDGGYKVDTEYLANGNEISIYGGESLKRTSLSSHFPYDKDRTYLDFTDFPEPQECIRIIEKIAKSQSEIRYIVTESEINMPIKITGFKRGPQDGSNDIYFTLDIIEHKSPKAVSWRPAPVKKETKATNSNLKLKDRPKNQTQSKVRYHTVKRGDCLWDIAFKYYRNGSLYKKIKNNADNQRKYPKLKKSNVIYVGWKLVIP